jgi:hypothetical protein
VLRGCLRLVFSGRGEVMFGGFSSGECVVVVVNFAQCKMLVVRESRA